MKLCLRICPVVMVVLIPFVSAIGAENADVSLFARAKAGQASWSKLEPVNGAFSYGAEIGAAWSNGFGVLIAGNTGSSSESVATGATSSSAFGTSSYLVTSTRVTTFTLSPIYTVRKGTVDLYFGLSLGSLMISTTTGNPPASTSTSKFVLGGTAGLDIGLSESFFINLSGQYLTAMGASPHAGILLGMVGPGFRF